MRHQRRHQPRSREQVAGRISRITGYATKALKPFAEACKRRYYPSVKSRPLLCHLTAVALIFVAFCVHAKPIKLRNQTIEPEKHAAAQQDLDSHRGLFLVQFSGPLTPEWREQLAGTG